LVGLVAPDPCLPRSAPYKFTLALQELLDVEILFGAR
jgi:hypothetical protein